MNGASQAPPYHAPSTPSSAIRTSSTAADRDRGARGVKMLRFRRYRVFLAVSVFCIVAIYKYGWAATAGDDQRRRADLVPGSSPAKTSSKVHGAGAGSQLRLSDDDVDSVLGELADEDEDLLGLSASARPTLLPETVRWRDETSTSSTTSASSTAMKSKSAAASAAKAQVPAVELPNREPVIPNRKVLGEEEVPLHADPSPPRQAVTEQESAIPTKKKVHWKKQKEHFPVPSESLIQLPTGKPVAIPKIQHTFGTEKAEAKDIRLQRQQAVKEQFLKAWNGYKEHAWKHDELMPVSGGTNDPFCGWAATLVDTLDTLWIMGLKEEFEEAVTAVNTLDFTTATSEDIPMFETTIRYLGGLLAAYDLSGGKYQTILKKAVELAEVLMGAFDTPNRMPVLYYNWKPAFASQPHRAGANVAVSELGSMSMEFTRLAQLTSDTRYYDAIARITNALSEWQDRGTKLDGVFPIGVDASGCNKTAMAMKKAQMPKSKQAESPAALLGEDEAEGYESELDKQEARPKKKSKVDAKGRMLEYKITAGEHPKGEVAQVDEHVVSKHEKRDLEASSKDSPKPKGANDQTKTYSNATVAQALHPPLAFDDPQPNQEILEQSKIDPAHIVTPSVDLGEYTYHGECIEQGLESSGGREAEDEFSMAGREDSTYEYFPKQYLLLGGLEPVYKKLYLKTATALRNSLLFRPMIKEPKLDLLFSGAIHTTGKSSEARFLPEVTHLACFLGGMVGMSAKVFGIDGDLEIAKQLTEGCVWAYNATATGIMPESMIVAACKDIQDCPWDEAAYYRLLDPSWKTRDETVAAYDAKKKDLKKQASLLSGSEVSELGGVRDASQFSKRTAVSEEDVTVAQKMSQSAKDFKEKLDKQAEMAEQAVAKESATKTTNTGGEDLLEQIQEDEDQPDLMRPVTHKQYVETLIMQQNYPPGFVTVPRREYILRPEAIESVWYMYRMTGDTAWQDKGWSMFSAIINATSVRHGHSAIYDVLVAPGSTYPNDSMQSFWLAETLKYFYLLYAEPDVVSLDDWVLNTEAHPFRRPERAGAEETDGGQASA